MPNSTGWDRIREALPGAIAYAIDNHGMQSAFTTPPIFHNTGRWVPTAGGASFNLGLISVTNGFDGAKSLRWAPDYEGDPQEQAALQAEYDRQYPSTQSYAPGVRSSDPRDKGPDAFGRPEVDMTADDLVQANLESMGMRPVKPRPIIQDHSPEAPDGMIEEPYSPPAESLQLQQVKTVGPFEQLLELTLAIADQLPKTKRAKVQHLIDQINPPA